MFQCKSNRTICLPSTARCNGTAECPRGEDEQSCGNCSMDQFQCKNKKCIPKNWVCDKTRDCDDGSDEDNCKEPPKFLSCDPHLFDCGDGTCIPISRVCDNHSDCWSKLDETPKCNITCPPELCDHECKQTTFGPTCKCRNGYRLDGDGKKCIEIDECKESNPCAQICINLPGSFKCSCFHDFMLMRDEIRCKSFGPPKSVIYSTHDQIREIRMLPKSLNVLFQSNNSMITSMDMNIKMKIIYYTLEDSNALFEFKLDNKTVNYVEFMGNPIKIRIDWITNNVYYIDNSQRYSIRVCHFENRVCIQLIVFSQNESVKSLSVDPINHMLFFTVYNHYVLKSPQAVIYSSDLIGTKRNIMVKGAYQVSEILSYPEKKCLYFVDMKSKYLYSIDYDGENLKKLLTTGTGMDRQVSLSLFEDHVYVIGVGTRIVTECKLYGEYTCDRAFSLNVDNVQDFIMVQQSRQQQRLDICSTVTCSQVCMPTKEGAKCVCNNGHIVEPMDSCGTDSMVKQIVTMFV